jgi:hypothetical protein
MLGDDRTKLEELKTLVALIAFVPLSLRRPQFACGRQWVAKDTMSSRETVADKDAGVHVVALKDCHRPR